MRKLVLFGVVGMASVALSGCGASPSLDEGVPQNVDMKKDYSPPVPLPTMTPKDMAKGKERAKTGAEAPKLEDMTGAKKK